MAALQEAEDAYLKHRCRRGMVRWDENLHVYFDNNPCALDQTARRKALTAARETLAAEGIEALAVVFYPERGKDADHTVALAFRANREQANRITEVIREALLARLVEVVPAAT
jgi:hypothetical protein